MQNMNNFSQKCSFSQVSLSEIRIYKIKNNLFFPIERDQNKMNLDYKQTEARNNGIQLS